MSYGKINLIITPDENFSKIIGSEPTDPATMIKKIWAYIRENKLSAKPTIE